MAHFAMSQVEEDEEISAETEVGSPENWWKVM